MRSGARRPRKGVPPHAWTATRLPTSQHVRQTSSTGRPFSVRFVVRHRYSRKTTSRATRSSSPNRQCYPNSPVVLVVPSPLSVPDSGVNGPTKYAASGGHGHCFVTARSRRAQPACAAPRHPPACGTIRPCCVHKPRHSLRRSRICALILIPVAEVAVARPTHNGLRAFQL